MDEPLRLQSVLSSKSATHPATGCDFLRYVSVGGFARSQRHRSMEQERQWLAHLEEANPSYHKLVRLDFERAWFAKFESALDGGTFGPLWLGNDRIAGTVAESLHYRDERVYRLDAYSIMRNHMHLVIKPLPMSREESSAYHSLSSIMQSRKGYTAFKCSRLLDREGEFWAHESYDHYVRDAEELRRIVTYVLNNPVRANYVQNWRDWKWNYRRVIANC